MYFCAVCLSQLQLKVWNGNGKISWKILICADVAFVSLVFQTSTENNYKY